MNPRAKLFGHGRPVPLDREAKVKLMHRAKVLLRARAITSKAFFVFQSLLWDFHNSATGICFPSYARLSEKTACARSTIALAVKSLERMGLITWHNRLVRVRFAGVVRLIRTSNAYRFLVPPSKSEIRTETPIKSSLSLSHIEENPLSVALLRLGTLVKVRSTRP